MKNVFKVSILLLCISLTQAFSTHAQVAPTQGVVKYKIDVQGNDQVASMLNGAKMSLTFKEGKVRNDMDMIMSQNVIVVKDDKAITLMDVMGQKYKIVADAKAPDPKDAKDYKVVTTKETKTIAGYECTKVVIKPKDGEEQVVYVTDKINVSNRSFPYKDVKGFPMEYSQAQAGIKFVYSVTAVDFATPVSDDVFTVSEEGYKEVTPEQLAKIYGGQ